ncbi:unnamed protein product [Sphagnum troendelagicum]
MLITMMDSVQQQEDKIMVQVTVHWWSAGGGVTRLVPIGETCYSLHPYMLLGLELCILLKVICFLVPTAMECCISTHYNISTNEFQMPVKIN